MDTPNVKSFGLRFRTVIHILMTFCGLFWLISTIVSIFACTPIHHNWDRSSPGACGVNTIAWWYVLATVVLQERSSSFLRFSQSTLNTISDVIILLIPMPLIKNLLKIPVRQKISLMVVFALGIFVIACTIVRMTTFQTGIGADTTYDGGITLLWSIIETNVAIVCACLPLLRPLFARLVPAFGKSMTGSKNKSYSLQNRYASNGHTNRSAVHDGTTRRGSWGDWKESNVIAATTTPVKSDSDEESLAPGREQTYRSRGITKQTDVDITTETASDHGSQNYLTECAYEPAHLRRPEG